MAKRTAVRVARMERRGPLAGATIAALLATFLCLPLALVLYPQPRTKLYGEPGDGFGTLAGMARVERALAGNDTFPHGFELQPLVDLPAALLARLTGEVLSYNLLLLLGFPAAAAVGYLACRSLGVGHPGALLAGQLFAFSPWHLAHARQHLDQSQVWLAGLVAWVGLLLLRRPTRWRGVALSLALVASGLGNWYLLVLLAPLVASLLLATVAAHRRQSLPALLGFAVVLAIAGASAGWMARTDLPRLGELRLQALRDSTDLVRYSARPLEYLRPPADHPVLGGLTRPDFERRAHGSTPVEQTLYVGFLPLLLALIGLYGLARKGDRVTRFGVAALVLVALLALWLSLPPPRGGSGFVFTAAPWLRAVARFGMVVQLAVALLAGAGFAMLGPRLRIAAVLLCLFEYLQVPAAHRVEPSEVSAWLDRHAEAVADYPPGPCRYLRLYRRLARARAVPAAELESSLAQELASPWTPGRLAALGVTHVVWHGAGKSAALPGFVEAMRTEGELVMAVTAAPPPVAVRARSGFEPPEGDALWMGDGPAELTLQTARDLEWVEGELQLAAHALGRERTLVLSVEGQDGQREVTPEGVLWRVPVTVRTPLARVILKVPQGGEVADRVLGNGDPRRLSVRVGALHFDAAGQVRNGQWAGLAAGFLPREPDGRQWLDGPATLELDPGVGCLEAEVLAEGAVRELFVTCLDGAPGQVARYRLPAGRWQRLDIALEPPCRGIGLDAGPPRRAGAADTREVTIAIRELRAWP